MQLYTKILIGLIAGAVVGAASNALGIGPLRDALIALDPVGKAFIRALTMIVVPLVAASLIMGSASLGDITKLGRIGGKTLAYYMVTTVFAVSLGLLLANVFNPGGGIDEATRDALASQFQTEAQGRMQMAAEAPSIIDVLVNIIPSNPVAAAANFEMLPLIFFSVIFGAAISTLPESTRDPTLKVVDGVNEASMVIIGWIMKTAPYAVFLLIAAASAQFGLDLLRSLLWYSVIVVLGMLLHLFGTIGMMVRFAAKLNPVYFFKRIRAVPVFAFSTSSSSATLPVTIAAAEGKLGISKEVSSFVLPLGATVNMDGTALYQAVAVMFIAQIYGIPLDLGAQLTVVLTATLASIGTAGVPGAGIIMLIIVLQSVGMGDKVEAGIALILGVDRPLDMLRTIVNVSGRSLLRLLRRPQRRRNPDSPILT